MNLRDKITKAFIDLGYELSSSGRTDNFPMGATTEIPSIVIKKLGDKMAVVVLLSSPSGVNVSTYFFEGDPNGVEDILGNTNKVGTGFAGEPILGDSGTEDEQIEAKVKVVDELITSRMS